MSTDGQAGARRRTRRPQPARRRVLGWLATALVVGTWWLTLAPTAIGGPANYVIVAGSSMEPRWVTGDIVVTRTAGSYGVGDIVAMETGSGKAIHRIVGGDAESGFTTQGDNRATPDGWTIQPDDVMGRAWFTAPVSIGGLLRWGPLLAGLLAFALVAWPSKKSPAPAVQADGGQQDGVQGTTSTELETARSLR